MTRTPRWLAERQAGYARLAYETTCSACKAPVLRGLDEDVGAFRVQADLEPLDRGGELRAVAGSRETYDLIAGELHRRDVWRIDSTRRPYPVHVEHRCRLSDIGRTAA